MLVSEQLRKAQEVIKNPKNWTKHNYHTVLRRGIFRREVDAYCARGAVYALGGPISNYSTVMEYLDQAARQMGYDSVIRLNDRKDTKHGDVMDMFKLAIEIAEEQEALDDQIEAANKQIQQELVAV